MGDVWRDDCEDWEAISLFVFGGGKLGFVVMNKKEAEDYLCITDDDTLQYAIRKLCSIVKSLEDRIKLLEETKC